MLSHTVSYLVGHRRAAISLSLASPAPSTRQSTFRTFLRLLPMTSPIPARRHVIYAAAMQLHIAACSCNSLPIDAWTRRSCTRGSDDAGEYLAPYGVNARTRGARTSITACLDNSGPGWILLVASIRAHAAGIIFDRSTTLMLASNVSVTAYGTVAICTRVRHALARKPTSLHSRSRLRVTLPLTACRRGDAPDARYAISAADALLRSS